EAKPLCFHVDFADRACGHQQGGREPGRLVLGGGSGSRGSAESDSIDQGPAEDRAFAVVVECCLPDGEAADRMFELKCGHVVSPNSLTCGGRAAAGTAALTTAI